MDSIVAYDYNKISSGEDRDIADDGEKKIVTVNGVSFTMIPGEGGAFSMGATSELFFENSGRFGKLKFSC